MVFGEGTLHHLQNPVQIARAVKTFATFALALALHLTLGWAWTLGAGLAGGAWAGRRGWLTGAAGVALGWAALVAYHFAAAPGATVRMARTVGGLLGNLPGFATVLATVLIGAALGAAGGLVGQQLRRLFWTADRGPRTAAS